MAEQPLVGQGFIIEASRSHSDTPHSVGLLWTSDQPDTETYLTTHNAHKRQTSMPRWDSNPQSQQASGADPRLRPHGHWDRLRNDLMALTLLGEEYKFYKVRRDFNFVGQFVT